MDFHWLHLSHLRGLPTGVVSNRRHFFQTTARLTSRNQANNKEGDDSLHCWLVLFTEHSCTKAYRVCFLNFTEQWFKVSFKQYIISLACFCFSILFFKWSLVCKYLFLSVFLSKFCSWAGLISSVYACLYEWTRTLSLSVFLSAFCLLSLPARLYISLPMYAGFPCPGPDPGFAESQWVSPGWEQSHAARPHPPLWNGLHAGDRGPLILGIVWPNFLPAVPFLHRLTFTLLFPSGAVTASTPPVLLSSPQAGPVPFGWLLFCMLPFSPSLLYSIKRATFCHICY